MRAALIGNLIISLIIAGFVALMMVAGGSGTIEENIGNLPRLAGESPLLIVGMLAHVIAPVGIIAALLGWRFGRWWTILFALMLWYDVAGIYWSNWRDQHKVPGLNERFTWVLVAIVLWAGLTLYVLLFRGAASRRSVEPA